MNIKTMQEGLSLLSVCLTVNREKQVMTISAKGVSVSINYTLSPEEVENMLMFLNINTLNWYKSFCEAMSEEKGGEL